MRRYSIVILLIGFFAMAFLAAPAFSQDDKEEGILAAGPAPEVAAPVASAMKEEPSKTKEVSIYGEVRTVNAAASTMSVQYYDYDSDEERSADITASGATKLENVTALADIKQGDWVDVTYSVVDGKNVASLISVEKEEEMPPESPTVVPKEVAVQEPQEAAEE